MLQKAEALVLSKNLHRGRYGWIYIECNELDIIIGLVCGELIVISRCLNSKLFDRLIAHKAAPLMRDVMPTVQSKNT